MTVSIEQTLGLIQQTLEKITQTGENVEKINSDSIQLGQHIEVVDSAMKEVEASNKQLVDNMEQVSQIVLDMSSYVTDSNDTSKRMLSKYDESATNINKIEETLEALMCELGIGGFMGIDDVVPGMKILLIANKNKYHGELLSQDENALTVSLKKSPDLKTNCKCDIQVTAGNVLYCWNDATISSITADGEYIITVNSKAIINNRRRYPRIYISNPCNIEISGTNHVFHGRLYNISANGFAFVCDDPFFADAKGHKLTVDIANFDLPDHNRLDGRIIRCSENDGTYIVGCQMPEDNNRIMKYVEKVIASE